MSMAPFANQAVADALGGMKCSVVPSDGKVEAAQCVCNVLSENGVAANPLPIEKTSVELSMQQKAPAPTPGTPMLA